MATIYQNFWNALESPTVLRHTKLSLNLIASTKTNSSRDHPRDPDFRGRVFDLRDTLQKIKIIKSTIWGIFFQKFVLQLNKKGKGGVYGKMGKKNGRACRGDIPYG